MTGLLFELLCTLWPLNFNAQTIPMRASVASEHQFRGIPRTTADRTFPATVSFRTSERPRIRQSHSERTGLSQRGVTECHTWKACNICLPICTTAFQGRRISRDGFGNPSYEKLLQVAVRQQFEVLRSIAESQRLIAASLCRIAPNGPSDTPVSKVQTFRARRL